ncbi:MAG TPA: hypothetical protein VM120_01255, partial [Bryobacteraceae bacterium]|nr:hypothetical protein [Bryobacteraceae bacterium]
LSGIIATVVSGFNAVKTAIVAEGFIGALSSLGTSFTVLGTTITLSLGWIAAIVAGVAAVGVAAYQIWKHWDDIKPVLIGLWNDIGNLASKIWGGIKDFFSDLFDGLPGVFTSIWSTIKGVFQTPWEWISTLATNIFGGIVRFLGGIWEPLITVIEAAWNGIKQFFSTVWGGIKSMAETVWDWIVGKVKWAVDKLAEYFPDTAKALGDWGTHADTAKNKTDKLVDSVKKAETPTKDYRAALDKMNEALGGAKGSNKQLEIHEKALDKAEKAADKAEKAHNKYTYAIEDSVKHSQKLIDKLAEKWNLDSIDNSEKSAKNLKISIGQIDDEITKIRRKFGDADQLPGAIKTTILHLEWAKDRLEKFQKLAPDMREIDQAFEKLNAEIGKTPGKITEIAPYLTGLVDNFITPQMAAAAEKFKTTGADMKTHLDPTSINNQFGKLGTDVVKPGGVLPEMSKATKTAKDDLSALGLTIKNNVQIAFDNLKTSVGNLGKNLANAAFMGKSFGDMVEGFEKAFSELGKSFITTLKDAGKDIFSDIVTSLISPITDAVDTVLKSIMESVISPLTEAIGSALERVTTRLTDWITGAITRSLGGIFGGGASAAGGIITATGDWDSVAGEAAGGAKGVAGAATGAIGSAVSAGIGGITNVITGAVSAISGIVGNFQMAGMNASLGLIEESTRYTKVQLIDVIQPQINEYWPYLKNTAELFKLGRIEDSIVYAKDAQWMFLEPIRDELVSLKNLSFPSLEAHVDGSRDQLTYIYDLLDQRLAVPATAGGIAAGSADQFDPGTGGGIGSLTLNVYAQTNNPDELAGVVLENILAYLPTA